MIQVKVRRQLSISKMILRLIIFDLIFFKYKSNNDLGAGGIFYGIS